MEQMEQQGTGSVILKNEEPVLSVVKLNTEEKFKSRNWSITLNNYTEQELEQLNGTNLGKIIIGKEVGENGTPHLQMYIQLKSPRTLSGLKKALKIPRAHLEPTYKNQFANVKYCSKEENVVRNDFGFLYTGLDLPKPSDLYDWQLIIVNILKTKPDDRTVYWFYEPNGNSGKSKFGKYLCYHNSNVCLLTATKSADILTACSETYNTYIFDFPRTLGTDYCPYTAIEQVKNGFITDSKLKKQARVLMFDPPHIICFSNYPPEKSKLSRDRWATYNIYLNKWEYD